MGVCADTHPHHGSSDSLGAAPFAAGAAASRCRRLPYRVTGCDLPLPLKGGNFLEDFKFL